MHKLIEYVCNELEDLERKADKGGKLSMTEVQYADTLAHLKKNLLKAEEMWDESDYSMTDGSYSMTSPTDKMYRGGSYARGGRRGTNQYTTRGYSYTNENIVDELRDLMHSAPNDKTRREFERFIQTIEHEM